MPIITSSNNGSAVYINRDRNTAVVTKNTREARVVDARNVQQVLERPRTVAVASPGPQGPAGTPGGTSETRLAATTLGGHRVVRATGANAVEYATNDDAGHGDDTLGLTLNAAVAGEEVQVQSRGKVTNAGWSWTPGEPVFLGRAGFPTQVVPDVDNGDQFLQIIGFAEDATTLTLQVETAIYF